MERIEMKNIQKDMVKWRRDLHKIPELGLVLPKTVAYISGVLKELGIEHDFLVDGNGIVGKIEGEHPGKVFALRADTDALPIIEETGLEFASTNGNMHACGHDGHTAMLLGAAKYLMARRDKIKGTIKLIFQPGEESAGGAKRMVEDGVLENPKVDAIFGIHEGNIGISNFIGGLSFKKGALMASSNIYDIKVTGHGAHGAYPHLSIDPITAASELILSLQQIKSREISTFEESVITVGSIHGGTKGNIIPEEVVLSGTIRTYNKEVLAFIQKRMAEICKGIELTRRVKVELIMGEGYPPTINDDDFTEFAYQVAKELFGEKAHYLEHGVMGAEDMSFYLEKVKGTYAFMVNPGLIEGVEYPHHHPKFDVDEKYFGQGALLLAEVALRYLSNN